MAHHDGEHNHEVLLEHQHHLVEYAATGNITHFKQVLESGGGLDVNWMDPHGFAALHRATADVHNHHMTEMVKLLIDHGAKIDLKDKEGRTALQIASQSGHPTAVKVLIDHGADINSVDGENCTPLIFAASSGHKNCVEELIEHGANLEVKTIGGETALMKAIWGEHKETAELLVQRGASRDCCRNINDERQMELVLGSSK